MSFFEPQKYIVFFIQTNLYKVFLLDGHYKICRKGQKSKNRVLKTSKSEQKLSFMEFLTFFLRNEGLSLLKDEKNFG